MRKMEYGRWRCSYLKEKKKKKEGSKKKKKKILVPQASGFLLDTSHVLLRLASGLVAIGGRSFRWDPLFRSELHLFLSFELLALSLSLGVTLIHGSRFRCSLRFELQVFPSILNFPKKQKMGVVIESSVWEPNLALYIFIFISCLLSIFLFPYASNNNSSIKTPALFDHGFSSSFFRFQRNFLFVYSLASGRSLFLLKTLTN